MGAAKVTRAKSPTRELVLADEVSYELLQLIADNPQLSQRDVARRLGVSLGKANYCLRAIVRQGWVKATNFRNSRNKVAYMYLLTPCGIKEKAGVTLRFLKKKRQEYAALEVEIARIRAQANRQTE